jgi:putative flavoprotein involved in K+ transport
MTEHVHTVVVGAGQAGLATSRALSERGVEHVVLERDSVGARWRTERWDSFQLLTPNWFRDLPGHAVPADCSAPDPNAFLHRDEVVDLLAGYADAIAAPVRTGVSVTAVVPAGARWAVRTNRGTIAARAVVVATGYFGRPRTPVLATALTGGVHQLHARRYRAPAALPGGGVLVAGAGPSGMQIADELARAGRDVFLAVGRHRGLPRRYRERDAFSWMRLLGMLDRTRDTIPTQPWAPAPNPVLTAGTADLDLRALVAHGVRPLGRIVGAEGRWVRLDDGVAARVAEADAYHRSFRCAVDEYVARTGIDAGPADDRPAPPWTVDTPADLDLVAVGVRAVVWATGYERAYREFVAAPAFAAGGEPVHDRGAAPVPGLYFVGLAWQHRRRSHTIGGVGADATHVADMIAARAGAGRAA